MLRNRMKDRARYRVARLLARLPDRVKLLLAREAPLVIDGQQLDPQIQLLRALNRRVGARGLLEPTIAAGRSRYRRETRLYRGPATAVGSVRDFAIPTAAGSIPARHYAPPSAGADPPPVTVYLHGGGFVIGDLDTHDEPCRLLCRHAGVHVVSVAYRLAPEHPFPAALDDAREALAWTAAHAGALGADPSRVTIGGDSAGANLAAVVSQQASRDGPAGATRPAAQLLIYPPTDSVRRRPSHASFGRGFFLSLRDRAAFGRHYTGGTGVAADDPRVSPLLAADLLPLAPALVVVAGFDVLRDEGDAYAEALAASGTITRVLRFPALPHGFIHMTGVCPAARGAMAAIAGEWRALVAACRAGGPLSGEGSAT